MNINLRTALFALSFFAFAPEVWATGVDRASPPPGAAESSARSADAARPSFAPVLRGPSLSAPTFFGQPSDVTADIVLGQPDLTTNADTGPCRTRIGYPMGSAYYVRGDSHYLFVADQEYSRVMVFDNANKLSNGQAAFAVIGQSGFDSGSSNRGGSASAQSLNYPADLFVDADGNLFVADYANHRVVVFKDPIGTDGTADSVFGQAGSFTSTTSNLGGRSARSLSNPISVTVDADRNVYIADGGNNRVLIYYDPLNTDDTADRVIGQADSFASGTANLGGISAASFYMPYRVRLDPSGNLYVTDIENSRGLIFSSPIDEDGVADAVVGQPNFSSGSANTGGRTASAIKNPCSLGVDAYANLYMADWGNNRVLFYKRPLAEDTFADGVFGQNDYASADTFSASALSLWGAQRIDFDPDGNLFISDCYNSRILKYQISASPNICPVPWITSPRTGSSVSGNAVAVIAHLAGSAKGVTIQFQYKKEPATTWTALGADVLSRPYMLKWNSTATGWSDGDTVWLRAAAFSSDCDTTYSLPVRASIKRSGAEIEENEGTDHEKKEKVEKGRKVTVDVKSKLQIDVPASALDTDAVLTVKDFSENPSGKTPDDLTKAKGIMYQKLDFENGPSTFKDSVTLSFSYSDSDNDGLIDGTDVQETTAQVYSMGNSDTEWKKHDKVKVNADSNTLTAKVSHFSYYAVFGSSSSAGSSGIVFPKSCLMTRLFSSADGLIAAARAARDAIMENAFGRRLTDLYYSSTGGVPCPSR